MSDNREQENFGVDQSLVAESSIRELTADLFDDNTWQDLLRSEQQRVIRDERQLRAQSYEDAHAALQNFQAELGPGNAYHKTYADVDGVVFDRRAVVQTFSDRASGPLLRLVVNDEGNDPRLNNNRVLRIRDYFLSTCAQAFSWQDTMMSRSNQTSGWQHPGPMEGPLLEQRHDRIKIFTGSLYCPRVPNLSNEPVPIADSIERRKRLQEFTAIITGLGVETYEPGIAVGSKLI
jgi:hypothetical protein